MGQLLVNRVVSMGRCDTIQYETSVQRRCMIQAKRVALSAAERTEIWSRWKAGQSLHVIGRAFDRPHTSIHCLLAHHGGIVPPVRRRSLLVLTAVEREDISRGLASGSSIRNIAKG